MLGPVSIDLTRSGRRFLTLGRRERSKEITTCRDQPRGRRGEAMRPRTSFVLFFFLLSLIGAETWASATVLPSGTVLRIRTTHPIAASSARPGTRVGGVVDRRVTVGRRMVIPSGTPATLVVVSRSPQRVNFRVRSIQVGRTRYALSTNSVSVRTRSGRGFVGTTGGQARMVSARRQLVPARTQLRFQVNRSTRIGSPMGR